MPVVVRRIRHALCGVELVHFSAKAIEMVDKPPDDGAAGLVLHSLHFVDNLVSQRRVERGAGLLVGDT
jgi:hypothetical protein